jgi:hypothetical protein
MARRSALGVVATQDSKKEPRHRRFVASAATAVGVAVVGAGVVVAGLLHRRAEKKRAESHAAHEKAEKERAESKAAHERAEKERAEKERAERERAERERAERRERAETERLAREEAKRKEAQQKLETKMRAEAAEAAAHEKEQARLAVRAQEDAALQRIIDAPKKIQREAQERDAKLAEREMGRIGTQQEGHESAEKTNGATGHIQFEWIEVADGIRAYYAERTGLPATWTLAQGPQGPQGPVYFVFERLCRATSGFWASFMNDQRDQAYRMGHLLKEGSVAFEKTLALYESGCGDTYDMWVAYVTEAKPTTIAKRGALLQSESEDEGETTGIEMVVTVLVHRDAPVTSHSGIFRTYRYWHREAMPEQPRRKVPHGHKGISPLIHAFAAGAALYLYPHLRVNGVMVTKPVPVMSQILRNTMRPGEFRVGSPLERRQEHVFYRERLDREFPNDGYSNELYTPGLEAESESPPFFSKVESKWTFAGKEFTEPEWMQTGPCEHKDISPRANDNSSLEHTFLLSALAQKWSVSEPGSLVTRAASGALAAFGRRGPRWI